MRFFRYLELGITKTESNNCFIIHCFDENDDKHIITGTILDPSTYGFGNARGSHFAL